ncbi:hypothetical protein FIV00_24700 [Labrenzia sp. THAF82]|nr:hypothetical protein FIV00_24700 [Labrenzia sp. THAF82]
MRFINELLNKVIVITRVIVLVKYAHVALK